MSIKAKHQPIENEFNPDFVPPPGDTIRESIEVLGMSQSELAERMGRSVKNVNQIINGVAPITHEAALELERVFNVPAHFWSNLERNFREHLAREKEQAQLNAHLEWMKQFPINEMAKHGFFPKQKEKVSQLRELLGFFGVASPSAWEDVWASRQVAFRKSQKIEADLGAIAAWLRAGEREGHRMSTQPYDAEKFRKALSRIRAMTANLTEGFDSELQRLCAEAGVAVVFQSYLKKTYANGATLWLSKDKALIIMSDRHRWEDIFWFTFFHEAAHILLHAKKAIFIENSKKDSREELEADKFSSEFLIPENKLQVFLSNHRRLSKNAVCGFAKELNIAPAIVVGRLHHEKKLTHNQMNGLRRQFEMRHE